MFFCALRPPRYLRLAAIGAACCGVAAGIGTELFTIFGCKPVSFFWERLTPGAQGSCLDPHDSIRRSCRLLNVLDITADVILAVLPCIMVWNLKMSKVKKCGVSILLGLGRTVSLSCQTLMPQYRSDLATSGLLLLQSSVPSTSNTCS